MIDPRLLELMPHTVEVLKASGNRDKYGEFVVAESGESYRCRVTAESREVRASNGSVVMTGMKIILDRAAGVTPDDKVRVTAPGLPIDGEVLTVLREETRSDEHGAYYQAVYCP